jgi:Mg2+/Co2+ transporter CorB
MLCGLLDLRNLTVSDVMIHCETLTVCAELPKQYSKIDCQLYCSMSIIDLML